MSKFTWLIPDAPSIPPPAPVAVGAVDHVAAALSRLCEQFKNKPNIIGLVTALTTPKNAIEGALQDLLTKRQAGTAFGVGLDLIGKLVGQARAGASDSDYARFINARIATNNSKSRAEDLIAIAKLALNDSSMLITVDRRGIAATVVRVTSNLVTDAIAAIAISFLRDAHAGGVKLTLETQPDLDPNTFFTALTAFSTASRAIGDTSIPVDTTNAFPPYGSIVVDVGGANVETVTYGAIDATHFLNCSPMTKTHASGVRVDAAVQLGLGLGDGTEGGQPTLTAYANAGTTGGRMEDARE